MINDTVKEVSIIRPLVTSCLLEKNMKNSFLGVVGDNDVAIEVVLGKINLIAKANG